MKTLKQEPIQNRFVFLIPAFNEEKGIIQTLKSIYAQSYDDWRIIAIDDMSTDNTAVAAKHFAMKHDISHKFSLVRNTFKHGEVLNTIKSLDRIEDDEIICRVDAGDWITDIDTLHMLNMAYNKYVDSEETPIIDAIWTRQRWGFTGENISADMPFNADVYKHPWVSSHMKTFRRSAFKDIPKSNFKDENGEWITVACDQAIFLPLLHKIQQRNRLFGFYPFVCYHYDIDINDRKRFEGERAREQYRMSLFIRNRGYCED